MNTSFDAIEYQIQEQVTLSDYTVPATLSAKYRDNAPKIYRLAKDGAFQIVPFGPLMTLAKAESYQADLSICFPGILVINTRSI